MTMPAVIPPGEDFTFYEAYGLVAVPAADADPLLADYRVLRNGVVAGWIVDTTLYPGPWELDQRFEAWETARPSGYRGAFATLEDTLGVFR